MKRLKLIFYGTPEFAVQNLAYLVKDHFEIAAVVTAPDKPAGRGKKIQRSAVKQYALENQIPVLQPTNLKDPSFIEQIKKMAPDGQVVVAFRMLPKSIWSLSRLGTINLHASLLPNYRGAAPINWAIKNGESHSGLTTFLIDDKIDTGAWLLQEKIALDKNETAGSLHDRLAKLGGPLLAKTLRQFDQGLLKPKPQHLSGTEKAAPKLSRESARINWNDSLNAIERHIRAMSPYPGAWTMLVDETGTEQALKIFKAQLKAEKHNFPLHNLIVEEQSILITTAEGVLLCEEIQLPGKRKMSAADLLNGYKFAQNTTVL